MWVANNAEQGTDDGDKHSVDSNTHSVQTRNNENDMLQAAERKHNYICYTMKSIFNHMCSNFIVCTW
jgi:hypothetical protein